MDILLLLKPLLLRWLAVSHQQALDVISLLVDIEPMFLQWDSFRPCYELTQNVLLPPYCNPLQFFNYRETRWGK